MPFVGDARHQFRPSLGVPAEDEERRFDVARFERVENQRRRVRIGAVVEREGDRGSTAVTRANSRNGTPEDRTVSVERAVRRAAYDGDADAELQDHTPTATFPRTF